MSELRILYVSDYAPNPGGAGSDLTDQMVAQRRLGNTVALCHDHLPEHVRRFEPDVLHFHTVLVNTGLATLEWAQWRKIPHCLSLHDFWPFCGNRMVLRSIASEERGVMCPLVCDVQCENGRQPPRVAVVVNGSPTIVHQEYQAARMRTNGIRVDALIECAVDTDFWTPAPEVPSTPRVFSSSAWFDYHWKGGALIDRTFRNTGVSVTKIRDVPRSAVRDALQTGSIFLFPSSYPETWGISLLEAMSVGLACIASAVDGPRVMIEDGYDGLLVPPRDEAALREATLALLADPERARRLGRRAAEKVRARWTLDHLGRAHTQFYERLLAEVTA